jgi:hypothetical protein
MKWTPLQFKKYEGETLPQVMFTNADWFFYIYERSYFKNGQAYEADEIYRRARSIRVPQRNGQKMIIKYTIDQRTGKFGTIGLIQVGPCLYGLKVSPVIDFYIPRAHSEYDKLGYKNFVFALKAILFADPSHRMNKRACEDFFNEDDNFDLAYAARNFPPPIR